MPPEEPAETITEATEPVASAEATEAVEPAAGVETTEAAEPTASQPEEAAAAPEAELAPEVPPAKPVESLLDAVNRAVTAVAAELHLPEPSEVPEQAAAVLTKAREALASLEQQVSGLLHEQQSDHDARLKAAIAQHEVELRKLHEQEVEQLHGRLREEHEAAVRERQQQYAAALKQVRGVAAQLGAIMAVAYLHALGTTFTHFTLPAATGAAAAAAGRGPRRALSGGDERRARRAPRPAQPGGTAVKGAREGLAAADPDRGMNVAARFCLAVSSPVDGADALANDLHALDQQCRAPSPRHCAGRHRGRCRSPDTVPERAFGAAVGCARQPVGGRGAGPEQHPGRRRRQRGVLRARPAPPVRRLRNWPSTAEIV